MTHAWSALTLCNAHTHALTYVPGVAHTHSPVLLEYGPFFVDGRIGLNEHSLVVRRPMLIGRAAATRIPGSVAHMSGAHPVFHPPYSPVFVGGVILTVLTLGIGIPVFSVVFQNKKHGFTK